MRAQIRAVIEQGPLAGAAEAYRRLAAGEVTGRIVVVPDRAESPSLGCRRRW